jgi:hypothetical protein
MARLAPKKTVVAAALAASLCLGLFGAGSAIATSPERAPRCTPGYHPCIRNLPSDVDCYGGSGNGPRYTRPGVVYRVRGSDRYGLDSDNDGRGCE